MDNTSPIINSEKFGFLLLDLREEFGQLFLYQFDKYFYVLRPLYLSELESAASMKHMLPDYVVDEWIISKALLGTTAQHDYLTDRAPAGILTVMAESIISLSSPGDIKKVTETLQQDREDLNSDTGIITSTMLSGAGNILDKDYRRITAREQSKYLALAESVLGKQLTVQPIKEIRDKKGNKRQVSPETAAMLSKEAADKPDFEADNKTFRTL